MDTIAGNVAIDTLGSSSGESPPASSSKARSEADSSLLRVRKVITIGYHMTIAVFTDLSTKINFIPNLYKTRSRYSEVRKLRAYSR
jgi:hypothetical protein